MTVLVSLLLLMGLPAAVLLIAGICAIRKNYDGAPKVLAIVSIVVGMFLAIGTLASVASVAVDTTTDEVVDSMPTPIPPPSSDKSPGARDQVVTAGTEDGKEIASREDAAFRAVEFARKRDDIEAKDVFVGEMTRAQYTRSRGGELGETIPDRDAPVWVVVIEPTRPITQTDLGHTSTYALYEVAFNKSTGRRFGSSYYYAGIQPAISMSAANRVELPGR